MKIGMTPFANAHDRFYDAPVLILDVSVSKNDIGEDVVSYIPHSAFSMVNLQPASGSVMLKEFGKQYDAQYRLSAPIGTLNEKNAVEYAGVKYAVLAFTRYKTYVVAMLGKERNNG